MSQSAGTVACMAGVLALGGVGVLASRNAELIRRWRTWLMSAPLVAGCLWFGAPGAVALAAPLGVVAAVEYGRLSRLRPADTVLVGDVGAWCAGRRWQGPALSPLSPAKRWSGALGGALAGVAALAATSFVSGAVSGAPGVLTPAHAIAVAVGAPLGDLLESMIKRGAGVKDAGRWLPGFGGLLDRIDSLLVVLALAVLL
jgi:CDP-diglyceride synthetase